MAVPRASDREIVVLVGGDPVPRAWLPPVGATDLVIAADSGLALWPLLDRSVDLVVGDLDSVDPQLLTRARDAGADIVRHPTDKDRTDLALALDLALERAPAHVTVLGGYGGRLDHLLANSALLTSPRYAALTLVAHVGPATATVIRDRARLTGSRGELLSLLPAHGPVTGVTTTGLRWALRDAELAPGASRGVSNEFVSPTAAVTVRSGTLLAVQPHRHAGHGGRAPDHGRDHDHHPDHDHDHDPRTTP